MDGSFSTTSVLAQEQVMAEQRKMLMINMTRKRMPNATQRYNIHGGLEPQSLHTLSTSGKIFKVEKTFRKFDAFEGSFINDVIVKDFVTIVLQPFY